MDDLSVRALKAFSGVPRIELWSAATALLLIDMQYSCVSPDGYTIRRLRECDLEEAVQQYETQLSIAIPNLMQVLERVRSHDQIVAHTHVVTVDGPRGSWANRVTRSAPVGSWEAQIIKELAPLPHELVVPKVCSGVFTGTALDLLLRRLGITSLIIGGVVTHGCVERAVTEAHDLGYGVALLSDGCASMTDGLHENALMRLDQRRAHVVSSNALLNSDILGPSLLARTDTPLPQATA